VGHPIRLLGYLRHRSGDLQLYVRNGWHVGAGSDDVLMPLRPAAVQTGAIGEATEGSLVRATGVVTELEPDAFWIDDGSGAARVFFAAATGVERPPVALGQTWEITGVVVENTLATSTGPRYRLQPRFASDVAQVVDGVLVPYVPAPDASPAIETPEPTETAGP
jgi:hypothetical protein